MLRWLEFRALEAKHKALSILLAVNVTFFFVSLIMLLVGVNNRGAINREAKMYPLLSKRIFVEDPNDLIINFVPLRARLEAYRKSVTTPLGIYFEYLPSGTSVGVDSNDVFFGASLLKLPVAMKAYRLIEEGKLDPNQEVSIEPKHIDKGFGNLWKRGVGAKITIREAIRLSVAESDNTADHILRDLVEPRPVSDVFDYLDIDTGLAAGPGAGVTTRGFSSVLRSLYLSSYLAYRDSNELLNLMTTSPHNTRIVAGVPEGIKVAHKVGIYQQPDNKDVQVHADCGLVYAPRRPYILCIMNGDVIDKATTRMVDISRMVYDYVSSVN